MWCEDRTSATVLLDVFAGISVVQAEREMPGRPMPVTIMDAVGTGRACSRYFLRDHPPEHPMSRRSPGPNQGHLGCWRTSSGSISRVREEEQTQQRKR
ncbi:hypothetical protein Strop_4180 [Salinispora tropica CNB-440]|uniref:Uncharacterized protein n=1 Tax=Salinispora tropica (strain ATCC BAA-916 / DSM 44818 / JCM 13857 / NBRC 105044 / CNB-440) TaxID=369723 RepID=A4XCF2_SALTO|nr:hypothetical protein Strop_4180 [Salinispora tropica CNB-440]